MSNRTYDTLKLIALVCAPLIVFLSTLLSIWNVPYQAQLTASLAAVDTLIGALVVIARENWDGGED